MTDPRVCLDLCSGIGGFSAAFDDAGGWEVVTVDLEEKFGPDIQSDLVELRPGDLPDPDVVLFSPPCTTFSVANLHSGHWEDGSPATDEVREAILLVYHGIGLIEALDPEFWVLENPRGMLRTVLGDPEAAIHYCQYGAAFQKPTDWWGEIPSSFPVRRCAPGADCHENTGRGGNEGGIQGMRGQAPEKRAEVPYGVSQALLTSVESPAPRLQPLVAQTDGGESPERWDTETDRSGGGGGE